jgi:hypothetical protein
VLRELLGARDRVVLLGPLEPQDHKVLRDLLDRRGLPEQLVLREQQGLQAALVPQDRRVLPVHKAVLGRLARKVPRGRKDRLG